MRKNDFEEPRLVFPANQTRMEKYASRNPLGFGLKSRWHFRVKRIIIPHADGPTVRSLPLFRLQDEFFES